ncbi:uncharacterized protein LOC121858362 [Homarus americanus]|uniref:uncharacterized protein LOC121858362 n=1 Tax=Homarus americanus TaxID=6706 RepID=UPI001C459264|nr:uncharacterized protein LOC121858362 [Homarus americanus]
MAARGLARFAPYVSLPPPAARASSSCPRLLQLPVPPPAARASSSCPCRSSHKTLEPTHVAPACRRVKMKNLLCVVAIVTTFLHLSEGRLCYNCIGNCVTDSECKGSCTTSVLELGGNEERSCINETVEARCISEERMGEKYKTCFCNTERCNSSSQVLFNLAILLLAASLLQQLR